MSDVSANPDDAGIDADDEQGIAESLDDDELADDPVGVTDTVTGERGSVGSDHPLASREAAAVLKTGDVPEDSVADRAWREEPETTHLVDDHPVDVVDPEPDDGFDPDFASAAGGDAAPAAREAPFGEPADPGDEVPGEVAAMHVIEEP